MESYCMEKGPSAYLIHACQAAPCCMTLTLVGRSSVLPLVPFCGEHSNEGPEYPLMDIKDLRAILFYRLKMSLVP